jgi:hypothetical protein
MKPIASGKSRTYQPSEVASCAEIRARSRRFQFIRKIHTVINLPGYFLNKTSEQELFITEISLFYSKIAANILEKYIGVLFPAGDNNAGFFSYENGKWYPR